MQFIIIEPEFIGSISRKRVFELQRQGEKHLIKTEHLSNNDVFNFNEEEKIIINQFEIYVRTFFNNLPSFQKMVDGVYECV